MYIKRFNENENANNLLLFYSFDWDDNILKMPTVIHMEKKVNGEWRPVDVSTSEFAEVRGDVDNWRIMNNNPEEAYSEFRDYGPRGERAFLEDVLSAISTKNFGPSWEDFLECLVNGSIFAIITARGHESNSIRVGIEWIIDNLLSNNQLYEMYNNLLKFAYLFKYEGNFNKFLNGNPSDNRLMKIYLDNCDFIGVSAPSRGGSPSNPEKAKEIALLDFKSKVDKFTSSIGLKAKIGFSDDDLKNVKHIEDLVDNLHNEQFPHIVEIVVKGTKDPENITKKIVKRGTLTETSHQTPGLENSVLTCTQFGNMTSRLYPQGPHGRQDDFHNRLVQQTNHLTKTSKDILGKKTKKKRKSSK